MNHKKKKEAKLIFLVTNNKGDTIRVAIKPVAIESISLTVEKENPLFENAKDLSVQLFSSGSLAGCPEIKIFIEGHLEIDPN